MTDAILAAGDLALRRLTDDDTPWIVEGCNDAEFARWVVDIPQPYTEGHAREFLALCDRGWAEGTRAAFAILEAGTGHPLGVVDLHLRMRGEAGLASVGYWLRAEGRGRGAAWRALRLVAEWALTKRGVERLYLTTHPDNVASQRVAEQAGFTREGLLRAYLPTATGRRDSVMFSLLPSDLEG